MKAPENARTSTRITAPVFFSRSYRRCWCWCCHLLVFSGAAAGVDILASSPTPLLFIAFVTRSRPELCHCCCCPFSYLHEMINCQSGRHPVSYHFGRKYNIRFNINMNTKWYLNICPSCHVHDHAQQGSRAATKQQQ